MTRPAFLDGVDLKKLFAYLEESGGDGWTISSQADESSLRSAGYTFPARCD
jgi:hypothetical protein